MPGVVHFAPPDPLGPARQRHHGDESGPPGRRADGPQRPGTAQSTLKVPISAWNRIRCRFALVYRKGKLALPEAADAELELQPTGRWFVASVVHVSGPIDFTDLVPGSLLEYSKRNFR